jgi:hypothetical protein
LTETVDLPTPPLPLAMATRARAPAIWLGATRTSRLHGRRLAGGRAHLDVHSLQHRARLRKACSMSPLICFAISALPPVNCKETLAAPPLTATSLTRPKETTSRE